MISWFKSLFGTEDTETSNSDSSSSLEGLNSLHEGDKRFLLKDFETALPYYGKSIEYGIEEGYNQRAMCLQALNYHVDALTDFDAAIALSPQDCNIYYMRSLSRVQLGNNNGAISDVHTAIELSQVKNEINRAYNEGRSKNGESPLPAFYTLHLRSIEVMAKLNEGLKRINQPIPYTSLRRPT